MYEHGTNSVGGKLNSKHIKMQSQESKQTLVTTQLIGIFDVIIHSPIQKVESFNMYRVKKKGGKKRRKRRAQKTAGAYSTPVVFIGAFHLPTFRHY